MVQDLTQDNAANEATFGAQVTDTTEAAEQEPAAEEADPCASARAGPQEGERPKALLYTETFFIFFLQNIFTCWQTTAQ